MLVQMISELDHSILQAAAHADVVDERDVLTVLAQSDSTRMRAHRHAELRGEQQNRERLAQPAEAATVELAEIDRAGLHQLLEHHAVRRMLSGRNADRPDRAANRGVAQDVVGTGRLFYPERIEARKRTHQLDRLADVPCLVRVHHHDRARSDLFAH